MSSKDPQSDYNAALALKDAGNSAFKQGDYKGALKNYSRIFMHIGMNPCMNMSQMMGQGGGAPNAPSSSTTKDPVQQKTDALRLTAFNNMAAVYAKMGKWEDVKEKCTRVLKHDEKNTKALFRRGMAYRKLNLYELARVDLEKAKEILNNSDAAIQRELKLLNKDEKNADKEFMKKMKKQMQKAQKKKKEKKKAKMAEKEAKEEKLKQEQNKDKNPNIQQNQNKNDDDDDAFMWDVPQTNDKNEEEVENKNKNNDKNIKQENQQKNKSENIESTTTNNKNDDANKNKEDIKNVTDEEVKSNEQNTTKKEEQPSEF